MCRQLYVLQITIRPVNIQLSACFSACYVVQAASLFPGTSPPGRDYVQWEHEALTAQDAVWQVPQCPCGDQPWGSHYFNLSVAHGVITQQHRLSPTGRCQFDSSQKPAVLTAERFYSDSLRWTGLHECVQIYKMFYFFVFFMSQRLFTILN